MSDRNARIEAFRNKFASAVRFKGGTVGGVTSNGVSTRSFKFGSGDSSIDMSVSADGKIVSVGQSRAKTNYSADSEDSADDAASAQVYELMTSSGTVRMSVTSKGRISSITHGSSASGSSSSSGGGGSVSGGVTVITGLAYDTSTHEMTATFSTITVENGKLTSNGSGTSVVFTATPHSGEI